MSKIIGMIGSRRRDSLTDYLLARREFLRLYELGDKICSGLCYRGGDWFAILLALDKEYTHDAAIRARLYNDVKDSRISEYNIPPIWYPADWVKYGRVAGFKRNTDIAATSHWLIALPAPDRTGGTEDTIRKFIKMHGERNLVLC